MVILTVQTHDTVNIGFVAVITTALSIHSLNSKQICNQNRNMTSTNNVTDDGGKAPE